MLVLALGLTLFLLVVGLALLGSRVSQVKAAGNNRDGAIALSLAEAGLEDARLKLERDYWYPDKKAGERSFVYVEELRDPNGSVVGFYQVTLNRGLSSPPTSLMTIESVGYAGGRENPRSVRRLMVEYDLALQDRDTPASNNPRLYRYRNLLDGGGL